MHFTDDDLHRIKQAAEGRLLDVVRDFRELRQKGKDWVCDCPRCGEKNKFSVSDAKQIFGCWSCKNVNGKGCVSYLMTVEGMTYLDAMEYLAKKFSVILDAPRPKPQAALPSKTMKKGSKTAAGKETESYCARMLAASGLTFEDVTASVFVSDEKKTVLQGATFRPGTVDQYGNITKGDDVIIEYYDLDGHPVTYFRKNSAKRSNDGELKTYYRVRWQYPDAHLDKNGKPFKYKSPAGSGTPIYIPERLRKLFREGTPIDRLYIQEGEKKAEKACKHGIPSIAVSGIQNLGIHGALPEDLFRIISTCQVKEVCFLFDSDWDDLSSDIKITDQVEKRPRCFYFAARNYKEYMRSLINRNIHVEVFIGHIKKNEAGDKGLDDLLANTLAGQEELLAKDIEFACNDKRGQGELVEVFKITGFTDFKLMELWGLTHIDKFAERHMSILSNLPEFVFGKNRYRYDEDTGRIVSAQPLDKDEEFWTEEERSNRNGDQWTEYKFCYVNSQNFLQNRGFGRYRLMDNTYRFIHVESPVVEPIEASDARDYLFTFAKNNCCKGVNEMLIKGVSQYVGPDKLSLLEFIEPTFLKPNRDYQYFYFENGCWKIEKDAVTEMGYESITHNIWKEQRKKVPAKHLGHRLITFTLDANKQCHFSLSKEAERCHFLQFLVNASNFTWRKKEDEIDEEELNENRIHLLSKLCAIGYMAMEAKDNNVARAVIGMDGKQSEVGESNGRSGKSLIGELMRQIEATVYIPGKRQDIFNDQFIWNDVQENTKLVFIDDVLQNFNFEFLFPNITGDWSVNYKGGRRITLPFASSPKLYIATNHAIRGSGSSFTDRQWLVAFSDYYNETHKPVDDFGSLFFSEWDYDQWNLCWNLVANCIQLYLEFGVVQAPGERLEQRKMRQEIGETIIAWADEYYSNTEKIGARIPKKDLYDSLCNYDPAQRKFVSPTMFKKKFILYCLWKEFVFNPNRYDPKSGLPLFFDKDGKPDLDDKSGGVEYFTVGLKNDAPQQLEAAEGTTAEEGNSGSSELPFAPPASSTHTSDENLLSY